MPTSDVLLKPETQKPEIVKQKLTDRRNQSKQLYDKHAREMQPLVIGDTVRVRDRGRWKPAKIVDVPNHSNPRSYRVKLPTVREWKRNRRDILKTREDDHFREDEEELDLGDDDNQAPDRDAGRMPPRRGLRVRRRPDYWHDYHYYN